MFIYWSFPLIFVIFQVVGLIFYSILIIWVSEWRAAQFSEEAKKDNECNQVATDAMMNFETVKYFNAEDHERMRYMRSLQDYKKANENIAISLVIINSIHTVIICGGLIINLVYCIKLYDDGILTIGDFTMLYTYILQIYAPMFYLGTYYRNMRKALTGVEQIFEILSIDQSIKDPDNPLPCKINCGEIEFRNVCFSYNSKNGNQLLKNISFKINSGESLGIVGQTGCGKSTILRLLYRFYDIDSGEILIDGVNISKVKLRDLRESIAIIPQDVVLFNESLYYNIVSPFSLR